ncbi:Small ubiquitin-related modifier [Lachnellula occidentalis]|uniref:Small ubiquitin-related modifier n=1 Tax=Lachnellula occidentalis TaxID=215460 RepID=A0A8H8S8Z8_9HELO|nr:Small ubiquitin-related modifier [Lachnellula occidentalis]
MSPHAPYHTITSLSPLIQPTHSYRRLLPATARMSEPGSPVPEKPEAFVNKPEALNIKVRDQDGNEMIFKIKGHTRMQKVIDAYCKSNSIDPLSRRFTIEGHRIQKDDTPDSLEMEDEDIVEVFVEQQGGVLLW